MCKKQNAETFIHKIFFKYRIETVFYSDVVGFFNIDIVEMSTDHFGRNQFFFCYLPI